MTTLNTFHELLEIYGWKDLGPQKNKSMISFGKNSFRMNIYTTTMTVTIQDLKRNMEVWKNVDPNKLEEIIVTYESL